MLPDKKTRRLLPARPGMYSLLFVFLSFGNGRGLRDLSGLGSAGELRGFPAFGSTGELRAFPAFGSTGDLRASGSASGSAGELRASGAARAAGPSGSAREVHDPQVFPAAVLIQEEVMIALTTMPNTMERNTMRSCVHRVAPAFLARATNP